MTLVPRQYVVHSHIQQSMCRAKDGKIRSFSPFGKTNPKVKTYWRVTFNDYRFADGRTIPIEKRFTYIDKVVADIIYTFWMYRSTNGKGYVTVTIQEILQLMYGKKVPNWKDRKYQSVVRSALKLFNADIMIDAKEEMTVRHGGHNSEFYRNEKFIQAEYQVKLEDIHINLSNIKILAKPAACEYAEQRSDASVTWMDTSELVPLEIAGKYITEDRVLMHRYFLTRITIYILEVKSWKVRKYKRDASNTWLSGTHISICYRSNGEDRGLFPDLGIDLSGYTGAALRQKKLQLLKCFTDVMVEFMPGCRNKIMGFVPIEKEDKWKNKIVTGYSILYTPDQLGIKMKVETRLEVTEKDPNPQESAYEWSSDFTDEDLESLLEEIEDQTDDDDLPF